MSTLTAEQIAANWAANLANATQKIQAGVQGVTVAPGQAAARQKAVYLARVQARADYWAQRTAAVTLSEWQADMISKGIPRIATGAQAATTKFATFMGRLLPYINSGVKQLPARGTLDQNITRVTQWVRYMAQFNAAKASG